MAIIFISATSTNVVVMFCGRCNLRLFADKHGQGRQVPKAKEWEQQKIRSYYLLLIYLVLLKKSIAFFQGLHCTLTQNSLRF